MFGNPFLNAAGAAGYIGLVVVVINLISLTQENKPDTVFAPVVFLSLLTLSVTVMAVMFFYKPLQLFIDGKKNEALSLFIKTVGIFAVFTVVVLVLLFLGVV